MELQKFNMTLSEARKYAEDPVTIQYLPEGLRDELSYYGVDAYDLELTDGRLTETSLFAYSFQSDEVAIAEIYSFDGAEFLLAEKYGDRTNWDTQFLNTDVFRKFVRYISDLVINQKLETVGAGVKDDQFELGGMARMFNHYILHSTDGETVGVHMLNPKWSNFRWMWNSHVATYDGEPVGFVRWVDDRPSWKIQNDEPDVVLSFPDGSERAVEGWKVRFILTPRE